MDYQTKAIIIQYALRERASEITLNTFITDCAYLCICPTCGKTLEVFDKKLRCSSQLFHDISSVENKYWLDLPPRISLDSTIKDFINSTYNDECDVY